MTSDPFVEFKNAQREGWSHFAPIETFTTEPAATLVHFAGIAKGSTVLDVGCGTGVVAITAARLGAKASALDLTPALVERGRENAVTAAVNVDFVEGDAEALPYADGSFDAVLSQFGHIFAPRAELALSEMLRVLRPGGTIAFSTWPPEHLVGQMLLLVSRYAPPPEGASPPTQWGDPNVVRARFGDAVTDLVFERSVMMIPTLSTTHTRIIVEATVAPVARVVRMLAGQKERLGAFRGELEALIGTSFDGNHVRQHYLMARAIKR